MEQKFVFRLMGMDFYKLGDLWINPFSGDYSPSELDVVEEVFTRMTSGNQEMIGEKLILAFLSGDCSLYFAKNLAETLFPEEGFGDIIYELCRLRMFPEKTRWVKCNVFDIKDVKVPISIHKNVFVKYDKGHYILHGCMCAYDEDEVLVIPSKFYNSTRALELFTARKFDYYKQYIEEGGRLS